MTDTLHLIKRYQKGALLMCALLFFCSSLFPAERNDIVVIQNGNQINGTIKKLAYGKLEFRTNDIGTIYIEWDKIVRIWSKDLFRVEHQNGDMYTGSFQKSEEDRKLVVVTSKGSVTLSTIDVVRIYTLEASFFQRLKGHLDVGFSYQKANNLTQWNLGGELNYPTPKNQTKFTIDSYFSTQEDEEADTSRNSGRLQFAKYLPKKYLLLFFGSAQQNQEMDLDLRLLAGAGAGRFLVQTNKLVFMGAGGLTLNREDYSTTVETTYNVEADFLLNFTYFRLDFPNMDIEANLKVIPSITDFGRVRIEFDARVGYEFFHDFYFGTGVFDHFDSRPPGGAEKNDFGLNMTITWKFK